MLHESEQEHAEAVANYLSICLQQTSEILKNTSMSLDEKDQMIDNLSSVVQVAIIKVSNFKTDCIT